MDLTAHKSVIAVLIIISMTSISIFWKDKYSHLVTIDRHYNQIKENIITDRRYPIETNLATTSVTILAYHSVREIRPEDSLVAREMYITSPALFTTEMQYLKDNNYHVVTMDDLMESLSRASNTPELALPTNSVIITFDDGYKSQHTFALPILQAFNYKAIFFIYTKSVGVYRVSMTWADVMDLKQKGMTIGGHTYSHPKLNQITDPEDLDYEIVDSKNDIENHLGEHIQYFAYPYGLYNKNVMNKVKESGYKAALADTAGTNNIVHRLYALSRHNIGNNFEIFKKSLPTIISTSTKSLS